MKTSCCVLATGFFVAVSLHGCGGGGSVGLTGSCSEATNPVNGTWAGQIPCGNPTSCCTHGCGTQHVTDDPSSETCSNCGPHPALANDKDGKVSCWSCVGKDGKGYGWYCGETCCSQPCSYCSSASADVTSAVENGSMKTYPPGTFVPRKIASTPSEHATPRESAAETKQSSRDKQDSGSATAVV